MILTFKTGKVNVVETRKLSPFKVLCLSIYSLHRVFSPSGEYNIFLIKPINSSSSFHMI